jgi:hypothetical protein
MTSEKLDELILSTASPRWQKIAMIIAVVARDDRFKATQSEDQLALIADRIRHLVTKGQLVAQGDISNWRHSEVRLVT